MARFAAESPSIRVVATAVISVSSYQHHIAKDFWVNAATFAGATASAAGASAAGASAKLFSMENLKRVFVYATETILWCDGGRWSWYGGSGSGGGGGGGGVSDGVSNMPEARACIVRTGFSDNAASRIDHASRSYDVCQLFSRIEKKQNDLYENES
ncbi:hypothetical protein HZH68_002196 [Vespula germanica]|uniref:Uncharacterized protein n=1 Tax=Vespula germanica TaxID=30212 RepID=A0A834KVL8_VESGE|nr:hypothetical protein HZH68_002196 [Vespula germanica]